MHLIVVLWLGASQPLLQVKVNHAVLYSRRLDAPARAAAPSGPADFKADGLARIERKLACLLRRRVPGISVARGSCLDRRIPDIPNDF